MYTPPPFTTQKKSFIPKVLLQILIIALSVGAGYWAYGKFHAGVESKNDSTSTTLVVAPPTVDNNVFAPTPPSPIAKPNQPPTTLIFNKGDIAWETPTESPSDLPIFIDKALAPSGAASPAYVYRVGKISAGAYKDGELFHVFLPQDGIGNPGMDRILKFNNTFRILTRYSNSNSGSNDYLASVYDLKKIIFDSGIAITELDLPEALHGPVYGQDLRKIDTQYDYRKTFASAKLVKQFDSEVGPVMHVQSNANSLGFFSVDLKGTFVVAQPDDTFTLYSYQPSLFPAESQVPAVNFTNDVHGNSYHYIATDPGGCGSTNFISLVDVKDVAKELVQTGVVVGVWQDEAHIPKTPQPIYEFVDQKNKMVDNLYKIYSTQSAAAAASQKIMSKTEFVKEHPLFLWQDPFGRFIKFQRADFQTMAECGKPVIYLYPEKRATVQVNIAPRGGMTVSDPPYMGGWHVVADPSGALTNLADKKTYPYLFWEGRGSAYESPRKGWMVTRGNVHEFLQEKLALLGLNAKERADFIEFWEPRMQSAPYYKVGFHGTAAMNELAPLSISPQPETIVRILMDYEPLQKPIIVEAPQKIITPVRRGFTVIEWGGVLHAEQVQLK